MCLGMLISIIPLTVKKTLPTALKLHTNIIHVYTCIDFGLIFNIMPAFLGYTLIILISTMCMGMLIRVYHSIWVWKTVGATVMIICVGMLISVCETVVPLYKIILLLGHDKLYV